jgi:hypothetical protein
MTNISKRLEQVVSSAQQKLIEKQQILPIKVAEGILVGDVLIVSEGMVKHLKYLDNYLYKEIYLNAAAIRIANILAVNKTSVVADNIYRADQEYGRWYHDSQLLRAQYQRSINNQDHDRADTLWARYCESRDRALNAKNIVQRLASI